jgi:leader peptidase (prepilin peptidase)/N-methyltransferase
MGLPPWLWQIFVFLVGLCVGSFLNVVVYRLPLGRSLVFSRSACLTCGAQIAWYDNIPLLSFLLLAGKCRFCKAKISWQYPAVELITGLLFLLVLLSFGPTRQGLAHLIFLGALVILSVIDIKSYTLPDKITLPGIFFGILVVPWLTAPSLTPYEIIAAYREAFVGSALGGWLLFLVGVLGDWAFRKESMGGGDIKLAGMIGAFLGWKMVILAFLLASVLGALGGVLTMLFRGWKKGTMIPFGPYLALGAGIGVFYGEEIWLRVVQFAGG